MRRKTVRDLEWVFSSPFLIKTTETKGLQDLFHYLICDQVTQTWLDTLNDEPAQLFGFILDRKEDDAPLGLSAYFNALVEFWLYFCPTWTIQNLHIRNESTTNKTANAFKIVFQVEYPRALPIITMVHMEVAVKFFLLSAHSNSIDTTNYVNLGLTPQGETLSSRMHKMKEKLKRNESQNGQAWLTTHFKYNERLVPIQSFLLLQGYIFYPLAQASSTVLVHDATSAEINENHLKGWWTLDYEVDLTRTTPSDALFCILPKQFWLSPLVITIDQDQVLVQGDHGIGLSDLKVMERSALFEDIRRHFKTKPDAKPLQVAEIHRTTPANYVEVSRGAVMNKVTWNINLRGGEKKREGMKAKGRLKQVSVQQSTSKSISIVPVNFKPNLPPSEFVDTIKLALTTKGTSFGMLREATKSVLVKQHTTFIIESIKYLLDDEKTQKHELFRIGQLILDVHVHCIQDLHASIELERIILMKLGLTNTWWTIRFLVKAIKIMFPGHRIDSLNINEMQKWIENMLQDSSWHSTAVDLCNQFKLPV